MLAVILVAVILLNLLAKLFEYNELCNVVEWREPKAN